MTDTGRVPGEGQPGHVDVQPEAQQPHPTAAAHGAYAYADPEADQPTAGDDEDLLMPGARSGWSDGQSASGQYAVRSAQQPPQGGQATAQAGGPRRPLHLGPPVPEQSGAVRTLADRGPRTPPPVQSQAPAPAPEPEVESGAEKASQSAPESEAVTGPEYLDVPHRDTESLPGPQLGELPAQQEGWAETSAPQPAVAEPVDQATAEPPAGPDLAAAPHPAPDLAVPEPAVPEATTPEPYSAQGVTTAQATPVAGPLPPAEAQPAASPEPAQDAEPPHDTAAAQGTGAAEPDDPEAGEQPASGSEGGTAPTPAAPVEEAEPLPGPAADAAPADAAPAVTAPEEAGAAAPVGPSPGEDRPGTPGAAAEPVDTAVSSEAAPEQQDPVSLPDRAEAEPQTAAGKTPAEPSAPATAQTEQAPPEPPLAEPRTVTEAVTVTVTVPGPRAPQSGPVETTPPAEQPEPHAQEPAEQTDPSAKPDAEQEDGPAQDPAAAPQPVVAAQEGEEPEPDVSDAAQPEPGTPADPADAAPQPGDPDPASPEQASPPISDGTAPAEPAPTAPAPGYDEADREAVHRLMRERRDVRNGFRPDPIPHDVLLRVLEAAHTAPSVGHSQPWDFVVIRSEETRRTMHELAMQQREAYAQSLPKARAKQFKELKVEAILDTPVNIVVTADPTRGGRHTLGRQTQPQMAPYSSALAVENLWLAARAEGLGVGWVSFFDEREMVRTLVLPEHLEVVAYLCIGYVDEFPSEPELMQAGWSKRRPLSWVVHEESYGRRALPGAEPHDLLAETLERIRPLDAKALGEAWERQKRMTKPAGALGMLEIISAQLCGLSRQCPPPVPEPAAVAVFAGDHGVHAQGVTPWPQEVTAQMVANFLAGGAVCNAFAHQVGAEVCIVDVGVSAELPATPGLLPRKVRPGTADMTSGPALTQEEVLRAIEVGIETARDLVAAGNKALVTGEMGIANTTASAALIAACTGSDPAEVTGRGTGIDDETHTRKVEVVRRALELHRPDPADPVGMLAAIGGLEHAALAGLILGGASLRTPVILDGVSAGAAALVARQIAPEALAACIAGHRSAEPGHVAALTKLGLRPLIDLDLRLGEGTGALLALPMVQSAARAMHEVATFDSAGVTEKS